MSGTSLDGIDVVLCEVDDVHITLLDATIYPLNPTLQQRITQALNSPLSLYDVGLLDAELGVFFASAIEQFLKDFKIDRISVDAIALHGQTLWHAPDAPYPFSMQLGDASKVAALTHIDTISDFRSADIANGGEGAPLAPAFHRFVFGQKNDTAVVNIGGMANITLLGENFMGYDSGCGNILLDYWAHKHLGTPYDKDGAFARQGKINQPLLQHLMDDPYFAKQPPKSTGREYFNPHWLDKKLQYYSHIPPEDVQTTLTELTAYTLTKDLSNIKEIIVCGGGAHNSYLLERLQANTQAKVLTSNHKGVSSDFMEAMLMAWLGFMHLQRKAVDLCAITGACKPSVLGALYPS